MGKPDALSRRPDYGNGASDNKDMVLLRPELIAVQALEGLHWKDQSETCLEKFVKGTRKVTRKSL